VLVLSASAGAGHLIAAEGLRQAFQDFAPDMPVRVLDVLDQSNPLFRRLYGRGYLALIRRMPALMGALYEAMDGSPRFADRAFRSFQWLNLRPAVRWICRHRPRLILNTHFLPAEIVARLRRLGRLTAPQATLVTDFETHRAWLQDPTDRYYVATDLAAAALLRLGVLAERILVTGIPVRRGFRELLDQAAARRKLGLEPERPVVLMLCGAFGIGPSDEILRELLELPREVQIAAIAGRNERLVAQLERIGGGDARLRVVGFSDQMHDWMRAADVGISKAGGLTVTEALVCRLPLVIVRPIPGIESRNSDYLLEQGAAIKVNSVRLLGHRLHQMLADPVCLTRLREGAARIARPDAARTIVDDCLALAAQVPEFDNDPHGLKNRSATSRRPC